MKEVKVAWKVLDDLDAKDIWTGKSKVLIGRHTTEAPVSITYSRMVVVIVCNLSGLKLAGASWQATFTLDSMWFKSTMVDPNVY
eukprot:1220667-Ditylum_brightwellii.AAC.1